jgi:(1->4)-alpha-D-glucan 1-alpha-D-glucosylmutase
MIPRATYRLQLTKDFTLQDAAAQAPRLKQLGITHLYLSPIVEATAGSTHGYDGTDFAKISAERGGEDGLRQLDSTLRDLGMEMIIDIVPNHMASSTQNPYVFDCLKRGAASPYWSYFDWRVPDGDMLEWPILGDDLATVIGNGELQHEGDTLRYYDTVLPLAEGTAHIKMLDDLLDMQHYSLTKWTSVFDTLHYRRFFDITGLIGLRVEDKDIHTVTHAPLLRWAKAYPSISGFRVDHIDGLSDPTRYLKRLSGDMPHIWVEKILGRDEALPAEWPVHGTTGYEFIDHVNGLLVDPAGLQKLDEAFRKRQPRWPDFKSCVAEAKAELLDTLFPVELQRLETLSDHNKEAWKQLCVNLPVYRTYGAPDLSDRDKTLIRDAAPHGLADALIHPAGAPQRAALYEWQQLSGPAMAKGLEDCAHYRYHPLTALNDVGCEPTLNTHDFFAFLSGLDHCLKATSTHDTKRSEDVRARLYALADTPDDFIALFQEFDAATPDTLAPYTKWFLLQTLLGTWPDEVNSEYRQRIAAYMVKAAKEARLHTSWLNPDADYETALTGAVDSILQDKAITAQIAKAAGPIAQAGISNSLVVLALKILSPGIPDFYQGAEAPIFALVDPDNRRKVDYDPLPAKQPKNWQDGKAWLTMRLLELAQEYGPFTDAVEIPTASPHIVAYRTGRLTVILRRYPGQLTQSVPALPFLPAKDLITGQNVTAANMFDDFPVRVFACDGTGTP